MAKEIYNNNLQTINIAQMLSTALEECKQWFLLDLSLSQNINTKSLRASWMQPIKYTDPISRSIQNHLWYGTQY